MKSASTNTPDLDIADVVARAQRGDGAAFEMLYHRYSQPLFLFLYARCADVAMAEDLNGDLWMRVVESLPKFQFTHDGSNAAFAGWLYRIARNLIVDAHRRRTSTDLPLAETVESGEAPLDEHAVIHEERQELRVAIEQLTPEQREVIMLRFVERRSVAAVAHLTERSDGAVKVMQHRALAALARMLGVERGHR